jgi:hypothetical protein
MSDVDEDLEFELITSARQLGPPPALRKKAVTVKDWPTTSGKPARFMVSEVTASDYDALVRAAWTYNPDGSRKRYLAEDSDIRLVAWTVVDPHGNRLWSTVEAAKAQLRPLGKATLDILLNAANEVNSVKVEDAEGNFEGTTKDSSPTTSPSN